MTKLSGALSMLSLFALGASLCSGARADGTVTFTPRVSRHMYDYIERAKVPPTLATATERDYVIESASCSPETVPGDLPGSADGTAIECRLYTPESEYRDKTSYEGGVELITIFGEVNLMAYGDLVSAVDIACKATRANASAQWDYSCTAGNVSGIEDKRSDN